MSPLDNCGIVRSNTETARTGAVWRLTDSRIVKGVTGTCVTLSYLQLDSRGYVIRYRYASKYKTR